jgi:site-specific DNA recombinase
MNATKRPVAREFLYVSKDRSGNGKNPDQQHAENVTAMERSGWGQSAAPFHKALPKLCLKGA